MEEREEEEVNWTAAGFTRGHRYCDMVSGRHGEYTDKRSIQEWNKCVANQCRTLVFEEEEKKWKIRKYCLNSGAFEKFIILIFDFTTNILDYSRISKISPVPGV